MKPADGLRVLRIIAGTMIGMFVLGFFLRLVVPTAGDFRDRSARARAFKEVAALVEWLAECRTSSPDKTYPPTLDGATMARHPPGRTQAPASPVCGGDRTARRRRFPNDNEPGQV